MATKVTWMGSYRLLRKWTNDSLLVEARERGESHQRLLDLAQYLELRDETKPEPVTLKSRLLDILWSPIMIPCALYDRAATWARAKGKRQQLRRTILDIAVVIVLAPIGIPILLWERLHNKAKG